MGLPDEDRETRRRNKRNQRAEYGAGLDEQDQWEAEQAARGSSSNSNGRSGGGLLDDLDDPDAVAYRSRRTGSGLSNGGSDGYGASAPAPKKPGRSKKSERYGIKSDHADLGNYGTYGKSSSSGRRAQAQNDAYDIVDDRRGSSRRSTGDEWVNKLLGVSASLTNLAFQGFYEPSILISRPHGQLTTYSWDRSRPQPGLCRIAFRPHLRLGNLLLLQPIVCLLPNPCS